MNNTISVRYTVGNQFIDTEEKYLNGYKAKGKVSTIINKIKETEKRTNKTLNEVYITSNYYSEELRNKLFEELRKRNK